MLLIALIALLLWIGTGVALFRWNARPVGSAFARAADRALVPLGGNVRVSLQLIPPTRPVMTAEPHDVVLVLDHSISMGDGPGSALSAALRAAENFVRRCPPPVRIGLIAFNTTATVLSEVTADRVAVLRGFESLTASGGTSIDIALAAAADLIAATKDRAERTTVILLSDGASGYAPALEQAARLREEAQIITVGFSSGADAELLTAIAGPSGRYCQVADGSELSRLFDTLASFVSSERVSGIIEERVSAPQPFQLADTGTFHPIAVHGDADASIAWSVPVMDAGVVSLSYDLVPETVGWHPVARPGGRAVWQLADGTQEIVPAPIGPRVLVLPSILAWAWPVLNPLFWILFGRFFQRHRRQPVVEVASEEPEPLTIPTLPAPLRPPQPALYETRVRPALIIGLGEAGEWAMTHLGHLLADRSIGSDAVALFAVRASDDAQREQIRVGAFELRDDQKIDLTQDLRPYLESLRQNAPPVRRWIPAGEWLGQTGPRTTDWIRDRREARLALLQRPAELEAHIARAVASMKERGVDETAFVVGAALDPECSGMIAEVAHMLSAGGAQTTALMSKSRVSDGRKANEIEALAHELSRMILMRGDDILSDRHDPPANARQLFDRLVVLRDDAADPDAAGRAIADTVWQLLAYNDVLRRVPTARADASTSQVECSAIEQTSLHFPVASLWEWVRARTLAGAVNGRWLGTAIVDDAVQIAAPARDALAKWVNAFWTPSGLTRPQGLLLRGGAALITGGKDAGVLALRGRLPVEALYAQQAEFAERERKMSAYFLEEWAQALLDESYAQRRCGIPLLLAALREIESGFAAIERRLAESATDSHMAAASRLAVSLYSDLATSVERFRRDVETRLGEIAGTQAAVGVFASSGDSACARIEHMRRDAEANILFPSDAARAEAERRHAVWYQQYGSALLDQMRVRVLRDGKRSGIVVELSGKPVHDDLLDALAGFCDAYRAEVLAWTLADVVDPVEVEQPGWRFRVGMPAARLHATVADVADDADPYIAATMRVDRVSVREAFAILEGGVRRLPYAWPEEANAVRIASLVTNVLERRPHPFTPPAVHLLRDTGALHEFFADLAEARIAIRNGRCWLSRGDVEYWIGESATTATAPEALANFERMARQVALLLRSLDAVPIPAREREWNASPEEAVAHVESNDVMQTAIASEGWDMWRDVIRGVVLDAEQKRAAKVA